MITPLVPPRHDGYPRFLSSGWPFYTGAVSTSVGFLVFCAVWLGGGSGVGVGVGGEEEKKRGKKKRE
jgi:oligosaccharyltransferase complex subunit beta